MASRVSRGTHVMTIRVTDDQHRLIRVAAALATRSVNEWAVGLMVEEAQAAIEALRGEEMFPMGTAEDDQ